MSDRDKLWDELCTYGRLAREMLKRGVPDRRERIATAALQGLLAGRQHPPPNSAETALKYADSLIEKLDDD